MLTNSLLKGKGAHVVLGPVVGPIGRSPFGGRNWEGFSPDPYLSGVLVEETVLGIQSTGVQACTKHYIGNEQEIQRKQSIVDGITVDAISSNIDDKTMHETYLWPFANAVKAGTASLMCSYNRLNGSYACQNSKILNGLLKDELGFQGYVMSDWLATHSGVASIEAGLDMNMPGGISVIEAPPSFWGGNVSTAVANGTLDIQRVDDMILRIMTPYYHLGQHVEYPVIDESSVPISLFLQESWLQNYTLGHLVDVRSAHAKLIRELGAAGTVLLKNVNATLPLKEPKYIGVFGNDAADFTEGQYTISTRPGGISPGNYDIGTLAAGGGSGTGRFSYVVTPLEAIKDRGRSYGANVQYVTSNDALLSGQFSLAPTPLDVCIVLLKSWAAERDDRITLLPEWNSTAIVETVAKICANTVVVLHGASPNVLPWKDNPNVTAILTAHFPGQESGNSMVDILWGDVNPSGRLPYTIANQQTDYAQKLVNSTELLNSTDPSIWQADFREGNLIDYMEFDAANKSVAYEFGFGLSYTTFELSDLQIQILQHNVSRYPCSSAKILPGGNEELWQIIASISARVKNTGAVRGAAVPQLYLSLPAEMNNEAPVRRLRGFDKISLAAGEIATVGVSLVRRDLSFWDVDAQSWKLPVSAIGVDVGFSSRNLKLHEVLLLRNYFIMADENPVGESATSVRRNFLLRTGNPTCKECEGAIARAHERWKERNEAIREVERLRNSMRQENARFEDYHARTERLIKRLESRASPEGVNQLIDEAVAKAKADAAEAYRAQLEEDRRSFVAAAGASKNKTKGTQEQLRRKITECQREKGQRVLLEIKTTDLTKKLDDLTDMNKALHGEISNQISAKKMLEKLNTTLQEQSSGKDKEIAGLEGEMERRTERYNQAMSIMKARAEQQLNVILNRSNNHKTSASISNLPYKNAQYATAPPAMPLQQVNLSLEQKKHLLTTLGHFLLEAARRRRATGAETPKDTMMLSEDLLQRNQAVGQAIKEEMQTRGKQHIFTYTRFLQMQNLAKSNTQGHAPAGQITAQIDALRSQIEAQNGAKRKNGEDGDYAEPPKKKRMGDSKQGSPSAMD
ncbi:hypothetical protein N0V90_001176 [Kalmusia sp. IMI 367209]|nr:hypothetical protein N0V90_001176 [Kalmusia sp. IMI 367209]